jgi:hypothetical protein
MVDAGLGDQGVTDAGFKALGEQDSAALPGACPIAACEFERENVLKVLFDEDIDRRVTQDLGEDDRRQHEMT